MTFVRGREGFPPPVGRVGCAAFILATVPLEEGRMNILTTGLARYHALEYFQDEPYLEGLVTFLMISRCGKTSPKWLKPCA